MFLDTKMEREMYGAGLSLVSGKGNTWNLQVGPIFFLGGGGSSILGRDSSMDIM